jgi:hypothetical protein
MPLIFPNNPTLGQTYQSGSSGTFVYNGEAWDSQNSNLPVTVTSASFATSASFVSPLNQTVSITGSLGVFGNLNVIGTASFTSVTASSVLVNQNTITVFGSGSALPLAGYRAADTASISNSGSFLYNFINRGWESSAPMTASFFQGTASFATSASFAVSSSRAVSASFATTASFATSSSFATTASFATSASRAISAATSTSSSFATTAATNTLAYGSIGFTTLPTLANNDATPSLLSGEGITTSGNTIIIARPGIYLLNATLPFRGNFAEYRWVDASNNQLTGTNPGLAGSVTSVDPISVSPAAGIVNITAANTIVKLRTSNVSGMGTQVPGYAIATITQIR